ncbi:MAG TPA: sigma factor [Thermoleophilia bacterium]|nr:sigma factor [Thermoleophilia bacterium]
METDARHEEEREIDARVVAQASHGDRAAFTAMVHHYERRLRVLAYQILQDPQAMDDALQEVFVAAYAALPGFRGDAALGTWLYRITCNVCLQSLRTASRRPAIAGDPPDDNDLPAREETAAVIDRTVIAEALAGATVLEIRGGKIARETIYCDHLTTRL